MYFEATGQTYHYVVSIWQDRVEIEVCGVERGNERKAFKGRKTYKTLSVMFPETEEQLRLAFATIVADCSN